MLPTTNETRPLYTISPNGILDLWFHQGQQAAYDSLARITAVISGTQGGKTSFGPWWLYQEMMKFNFAGDYLAATATFDLFKLKMLPEMKAVFEDILDIGRYWAMDRVIELRNPTTGAFQAKHSADKMYGRIILRSASAPGGLESATANAAWLDEAGHNNFGLDAWEAILRRLSLARGRVLITTTPYNLGWLKQKVYDPWRKGDPDIEVIQFASTMNPLFSQAEFDDRQRKMPAWRFNMFYRGLFERPAGLIYRDFIDEWVDSGGHKVAPMALPRNWARYVGGDPGGSNFAKLWGALDKEHDILYVYRENKTGDLTTKEHVNQIHSFKNEDGQAARKHFIGTTSEKQTRMDMAAAGLRHVYGPTITDVESGIDAVIERIKTRRLFVFDNLSMLLDELGRYSRKLDSNNEPTDEIDNKNAFHMLDALRYLVVGIDHKQRRSQTTRSIEHDLW